MEIEESRPGWPGPGVIGAWQTMLVVGIVTLILGLIVSFHPSGSLNVIAVLIGVLVIVSGLFHLARMFGSAESHRVWLGISGLLLIVLGVVLLRHLNLTVALIGLLVGISWIIQGLSALAGGMAAGPGEGRGWWIFFGIISLIAGIVVAALPVTSVTALAVLVGIWFIIQGLVEIVGGFMLRRTVSKAEVTIINPPPAGQGAPALEPRPGHRRSGPAASDASP
jgi:uncharacterized membrane protein HdeD (DUF308 family)